MLALTRLNHAKHHEKLKKTQKNTKIIDFTKGVLTIKTKNTTWKNEMLFMKEEVKKNSQTKTTQY